ncbi:NAD(P)H-dependent oxidoreductase [Tissierella carlieri]|uniref:NAD(P)H-dependent oxidoreductase n=1 Tax=Tissierella carlieri TaxID=689904 RepID=A0ABT1SF46_9FIRM|nr:NAD(P)H-dependent oxidoreductase [Tissierella carlieri]MCQ4925106.1 NAD(P)H-dependent oxidoreductase [Tissierella carlieri]
MKVVIIYGNGRKGSTYNCVQIIKRTIGQYEDVKFEEIWLPKDLPELCCGCFNCILKGEWFCPHSEYVSPIVSSIIEADGIILASPAYGLDVSGAMKTLIDHLCFMWMPHRPHNEMFSKIGFVVSTAAGSGMKRTNKTMKLTLNYMGFKRVYDFGSAVAASRWEDVKGSKKLIIEKKLIKKSQKYYQSLVNRKKLKSRLSTRLTFTVMRKMISGYQDGNVDKEYWKSMGWFDNVRPV